jgi:WD40 repeat protein
MRLGPFRLHLQGIALLRAAVGANQSPPQANARYSAFVSYSHASDDKLAPAVQHALHTFAKPWYRLRAMHVFRDKTNLSASPGLWQSIETALAQSEWFLFMASPRAAQSHWVGQEITWWLRNRGSARMLILLTDGDLAWDDATNDFEAGPTSAVPDLLHGAFAEEPLFVDLRWAKAESSLSIRHSQFRAAILDIVATVQGRSKDELDGEDVQQNRRNRRWAWGAGIALTMLTITALLAACVAVQQRNQAEDRRQIALSRQIATQSLHALGDRHLDTALLLALESGKALTSERTATPSGTFDARSSLLSALQDGWVPIVAYWHNGSPLAFSPGGGTFASAEGSSIVIRETRTRQRIGPPLPGQKDGVRAIAFSPNGKVLAFVSTSENNVMLLSLDGPDPVVRQTTIENADALAISPDGETVAIGAPSAIHLLSIADLKPIAPPLPGHSSNVVSLAYSRDGRILASGSWDRTVMLWDTATRQPIGPALQGFSGQVESVAFSPNGSYLATGGGDGVRLWDVATRQPLGPFLDHAGGVKSVAFSPDSNLLASVSGTARGTVILWSTATREPVGPPLQGHTRWINEVAFSPDGGTLASVGGEDVTLFWDLRSASRLGLVLPGGRNTEDAIAISRDGARAASSVCLLRDAANKPCRKGGVRLWDLAARAELWTATTGCPVAPTSLAFRTGTDALVMVGCPAPATGGGTCKGVSLQIWNPGPPVPLAPELRCIADDRDLSQFALSADGDLVAAASCESGATTNATCEIRVWNTEGTGQVGAGLVAPFLFSMVFSPDRRTLATSSLDEAVLWDVSTGKPRSAPQPGNEVAFSADGKLMAVSPPPASQPPRSISLRDAATDQPVGALTLREHEVVLRMAFSPDRETLAVSSIDADNITSTTLWDLSRRERLGGPLQATGRALAFDPHGTSLAIGSSGNGMTLFDVAPESWLSQACIIAGRNLTFQEWTQSLGDVPYRLTCPDYAVDPSLLEAGRQLAETGDVDGAEAIFARIQALDPARRIEPRKEAIRFSVESLVKAGNYMAERGDVEGATTRFVAARKLDPDLRLDPPAEAKKLAAPGLLVESENLALSGKVPDALASITQAQKFDPALRIPAASWNTLCWNGSLRGQAAEVSAACNKAGDLEPDNGRFHTSRGVSLAMLHRGEEAIRDFQVFLDWVEANKGMRWAAASPMHSWLESEKQRHEQWIGALRSGHDPFTPELLQALVAEHRTADGNPP